MKPQLSGADVMLRTPSKLAVRPPRPPSDLGRAATRRTGGAGREAPPNQYRSAYDRRANQGDEGSSTVTRDRLGRQVSAPAAVTAALPKLIVRLEHEVARA